MNSENPIARKPRYKNGVLAALEICGDRRAQQSGFAAVLGEGKQHAIERTAAIVEAAAERLQAGDFSALEAVCAARCWRSM